MKIKLNDLSQRAYETAKANGFHDEEHPLEHHLCLIITEIVEMVQADRKKRRIVMGAEGLKHIWDLNNNDKKLIRAMYDEFLCGTFEEEVADTIIRVCDLAQLLEATLIIDTDIKYIKTDVSRLQTTGFAFILIQTITNRMYHSDIPLLLKMVVEQMLLFAFSRGMTEREVFDTIEMKMEYNETRPAKHNCLY